MRYDPWAEPTVGTIAPGRPAYVPRRELVRLAETPGRWARRWRLGGTITAVEVVPEHAIVRPLEDWGGRSPLERAIAFWMGERLRAGSPAELCRQLAPEWYERCPWSAEGWARPYLRGGWEEASVRGVIYGPHRLLDLRRAYRWALTAAPLPDRATIRVARRFLSDEPGLHALELREPWRAAPWPAREGGTVLVETPLELEQYGPPPPFVWRGGITWRRTVMATRLAERLDQVGVPALHRAYWGVWAATTPGVCEYRTGTVQPLPRPRWTDAVRAHLIVQRVRRRLAEIEAPYRYVDSVIVRTGTGPAVGEGIGDWRLVREYPDGVWIGWPGAYGPPDGPPDRLAGQARSAR